MPQPSPATLRMLTESEAAALDRERYAWAELWRRLMAEPPDGGPEPEPADADDGEDVAA